MASYYFLTTVEEKSKIKVRPISGQKFADGTSISDSLFVSCSKDFRIVPGSILICKELKLSKTGKYYTATGLSALDSTKDSSILSAYKTITGVDFIPPVKYLYETISTDPTLKVPTSSGDGFFMKDSDWKLLIRNIKRHVNTMILGPTGCGKTSCVKEVCTRLGIPLYVFDMGSMIDPISSLLGVHRIKDGKSIFDYAEFTKVIQEPCVILLDEINRSSMGSNNILFPVLDDRRSLNIEVATGDSAREIKVHPEVTFIATANIGSEYTGTLCMDRALTNRFFPLELGTIPTSEEEKVLMKRTGISPESSEQLVKIANNIRSMAKKGELSTSISIRETLMVSQLVTDGWPLKKAIELTILPLFDGDATTGERSTVTKLILSY